MHRWKIRIKLIVLPLCFLCTSAGYLIVTSVMVEHGLVLVTGLDFEKHTYLALGSRLDQQGGSPERRPVIALRWADVRHFHKMW